MFEEGASLTLSGYTNGFVVENATLSGGGWVITDGDGMDLIRLRTGGKLTITDDVDLNGYSKTESTSRGIILESTAANGGQQITLAANTTLSANNFYRGLESGGAKGYTVSGASMDISTFDFSNNNCGMALSYFDQDANFKDCKLEVSNCDGGGIFMRQDSAALTGLYFNSVNINCVNTDGSLPTEFAVRFHAGPFQFNDSVMTIDGSKTTGLWLYDGWDTWRTGSKIDGSVITVKNVTGTNGKAITFAPRNLWKITDSVINMENCGYGGINISNDTQVNHNGSLKPADWVARPGLYGGTIAIDNTTINSTGIEYADIGVQLCQFLEIGENVVINNGNATNRRPILCDGNLDAYYEQYFIFSGYAPYNWANIPEEYQVADRVTILGGSIGDFCDESQEPEYINAFPTNGAQHGNETLTMFTVSSAAYSAYSQNGEISLLDINGVSYQYGVANASSDGNRYIWAPKATVTFYDTDGQSVLYTIEVPRGAAFGLTQSSLPNDSTWVSSTSQPFGLDTVVSGNISVYAQ